MGWDLGWGWDLGLGSGPGPGVPAGPPPRPLSACAILRYNGEIFRYRSAVGELIEQGSASGGFSFLSGLVCLVALGLYGLMARDQENNDDDDSSPGGGLMQPVA